MSPERTPPTLLPPAPPEAESTGDSAADAPASACNTKPPRHDDPTRYGDWELSGKCVDF